MPILQSYYEESRCCVGPTERFVHINRVEYHEVDTGHDLVDPRSGAWNQLKEYLLLFAASLRKQMIMASTTRVAVLRLIRSQAHSPEHAVD